MGLASQIIDKLSRRVQRFYFELEVLLHRSLMREKLGQDLSRRAHHYVRLLGEEIPARKREIAIECLSREVLIFEAESYGDPNVAQLTSTALDLAQADESLGNVLRKNLLGSPVSKLLFSTIVEGHKYGAQTIRFEFETAKLESFLVMASSGQATNELLRVPISLKLALTQECDRFHELGYARMRPYSFPVGDLPEYRILTHWDSDGSFVLRLDQKTESLAVTPS